jgi:hypothetical protein
MDDFILRVYLLCVIICPVIAFYRSKNKLLIQGLSRSRVLIHFTVISVLPLFSYIVLFLLLIAVEEVFNKAIISEMMGRSFILNLLVGIIIALLSVIAFAIYTIVSKENKN